MWYPATVIDHDNGLNDDCMMLIMDDEVLFDCWWLLRIGSDDVRAWW